MEITPEEQRLRDDKTLGRMVDLLKRFNVSRPTLMLVVKDLQPQGEIKKSKWYKIADVARALKKRRAIGPNTKTVVEISKKDAQIQQILAQTKLKEIEIAEREGSLVAIDEVGKTAEKFIIGLKQILLTFPDRFSVQCENRSAGQVKKILQDGIDEVLNELASFDPCGDGRLSGEDAEGNGVVPSTGENDGINVGEEVPETVERVVGDGGEVATEPSAIPDGGDGGDIGPVA